MVDVGRSQGTPAPSNPDPGAAGQDRATPSRDSGEGERFRDALKRDGKSGKDGKDSHLPSGADLLAGMGASLRTGGGVQGAARQAEGAAQAGRTGETAQLVDKLADRILVSRPQPGADASEVRIRVSRDVLPDTEVRLVRTGGELRVELVTDNVNSNHILRDHAGALQNRLSGRLDDAEVTVEVNFQDGDGQPGDGRSRQQRDLYDEMNDDDG